MSIVLCAIAKNENNYIREWIAHYKNIGFDHIILYDNNDVDGEVFDDVIADYIQDGYITIKNVRGLARQQIPCYDECYHTYSKDYNWIAYFDLDEFLELDCKNIHSFLENKSWAKFDCIVVSWKTYDDSNIVNINNNYSISRFKTFIEDDIKMTKRIYRTKLKNFVINSPHGALNRDGQNQDNYRSCNTKGEPTTATIQIKNGTWENARLNHYRYKTIEEFVTNKMKRGYPTWWLNDGKDLGLEQFFKVNKLTLDKIRYVIHKFGVSFEEAEKLIGCSLDKFKKEYYKTAKSIFYWKGKKNVGDVYGKWLIENYGVNTYYSETKPELAMCGSILQSDKLCSTTLSFGCGLHNADNKSSINIDYLYGVRGKLTYQALNTKKELSLGDPGLLLSKYYQPQVKKKYKYGIVCHWRDLAFFEERYKDTNVHIISTKTTDVEYFADQLAECEFIFSTSLHGIIFSHSLSIPAVHLERAKLESKDNFKFKDYYSVLGIKYIKLTYTDDFNFDRFITKINYDEFVPNKKVLNKVWTDMGAQLGKLVFKLKGGKSLPKTEAKYEPVVKVHKKPIIKPVKEVVEQKPVISVEKLDVVIHFMNENQQDNYLNYCHANKVSPSSTCYWASIAELNQYINKIKQLKNVGKIYILTPNSNHLKSDKYNIIYYFELGYNNYYNYNIISIYLNKLNNISDKFIYLDLFDQLPNIKSVLELFIKNKPKLFNIKQGEFFERNKYIISDLFESDKPIFNMKGFGLTKDIIEIVNNELGSFLQNSDSLIDNAKTFNKDIYYNYVQIM